MISVSPNVNEVPDAGVQIGVISSPELSDTVMVYDTATVSELDGSVAVVPVAVENTGRVSSVTVTVNVVVSEFPELSDAVHETVVSPKVN